MTAFYNEVDPFAAQWLRNLIAAGHIAPGMVDERSIEDITPEELHGFTQCHFFAGLGGWSYALRLAGWPDDRPVWTGSCPCQPFSSAGKGGGFADERHLWPAFHHLIRHHQPPVVFGEQVASKDGRTWFSLVHSDLEGVGYRVGAADLCAAGVGAPHIRQRLYWMAQSYQGQRGSWRTGPGEARGSYAEPSGRSEAGGVAHGDDKGLEIRGIELARSECQTAERGSAAGGMAHSLRPGWPEGGTCTRLGQITGGGWSDCDWLSCRDGKLRPVEPGAFPLAHGAPSRVGRLRAYGNAIVPQVAAEFIKAAMEAVELREMLS